MSQQLDHQKTIDTIRRLEERIVDRFPASGLSRIAKDLCAIATASVDMVELHSRPNIAIRLSAAIVIMLGVLLLGYSISQVASTGERPTLAEFVQVTEAAINTVVFLGAAVYFLITFETRVRRGRVLKALHELRAIAHVIDMHQLTKDPSMEQHSIEATPASPKRTLTQFQLLRYLDYCSELFSLVGKLSALHSQNLSDPIVISAANDIETLCSGLSRKVWQKISLLKNAGEKQALDDARA
ncbi:MAG: hypothetical protein JRG89_11565 [Deltaproteobacteria bacterium]|nr:hypothetical protein [Deltaproteobacteria bacterium]MBW2389059.1 hypothetical protein [Deltaproteobacteria bacterium]